MYNVIGNRNADINNIDTRQGISVKCIDYNYNYHQIFKTLKYPNKTYSVISIVDKLSIYKFSNFHTANKIYSNAQSFTQNYKLGEKEVSTLCIGTVSLNVPHYS